MPGRELLVARDRVGAAAEDVVEVDEVPPALLGLVAGVVLGDPPGSAGWPAPGRVGRGLVVVGGDEARLRPFDLGRDVGDRHGGGRAPGADDRAEQAGLAVEHPRRFAVALGGVAAELCQGDRVEGPGGDPPVDAEPADTRDELARGLAGERDRQHVLGDDAVLPGAVGDAARQARGSCPSPRER